MNQPFVHMELNTTDVPAAKSFYTALFGWPTEDMDMGPAGTYVLFKPGSGPGGGMMKHPVPGAPSLWLPYIGVDDIHSASEEAHKLGARILSGIKEVPNRGLFNILEDPTGAAFAIWQDTAK